MTGKLIEPFNRGDLEEGQKVKLGEKDDLVLYGAIEIKHGNYNIHRFFILRRLNKNKRIQKKLSIAKLKEKFIIFPRFTAP